MDGRRGARQSKAQQAQVAQHPPSRTCSFLRRVSLKNDTSSGRNLASSATPSSLPPSDPGLASAAISGARPRSEILREKLRRVDHPHNKCHQARTLAHLALNPTRMSEVTSVRDFKNGRNIYAIIYHVCSSDIRSLNTFRETFHRPRPPPLPRLRPRPLGLAAESFPFPRRC